MSRRAPTRWGDPTGIGLTGTENVLADRREAGRLLAERLMPLRADSPLVLAIPPGGVAVAAEVAGSLGAPLDVLLVGALSLPQLPESAFGFIGEGDTRLPDVEAMDRAGVTDEELARLESDTRACLMGKGDIYRSGRKPIPVDGRTVIVVADGLDNEDFARAAVRLARAQRARRVILATPVVTLAALHRLQADADDVIGLITPTYLVAVGLWYRNFPHMSDNEVIAILRVNAMESAPTPPMTGCRCDRPLPDR